MFYNLKQAKAPFNSVIRGSLTEIGHMYILPEWPKERIEKIVAMFF
jgi:hypothetical protein